MRVTIHKTLCAAGLVLALLAVRPLCAQEQAFQLDPAQSRVDFTLGDVLHTVHGTFQLKPGTIQFDPATATASGQLILDANSGDSGNGSRDRKMKKDILQTQKYPDIVFTAQRLQGTIAPAGVSNVQVLGIMSLHGQEHPMTLPIKITRNGSTATADTTFIVPYVQWGLKNPSTFILRVSDKVQIAVHAVGRIAMTPAL